MSELQRKLKKPIRKNYFSYLLFFFCGLIFLYLILPIFIIIPISFSSARFLTFPPPGYSLQWYKNYLFSRDWMEATFTSLQVASITTVFSTILGTLLAFILMRGKFRFKNWIYTFAVSPTIVPPIIVAIAIYFFYSKIQLVGTVIGMVMAHTILATPFVLVIVSSTLKGFDETLEKASLSLGATPFKTFIFVTLPLIKPGLLSASFFAFITSFDELVIAIFIAGTHAVTLPKRMWDGIRLEIDPTISAVSSIFIGISILLMILIEIIKKRTLIQR